ncbi:MAG: hypothetical protein ABJN14_12325 [Paracoccaceae bacterium]
MPTTDFDFYGVKTRVVVSTEEEVQHLLHYYSDHSPKPGPVDLTIQFDTDLGVPFFAAIRDAEVEKQIWLDTGAGLELYEAFNLGATRRTPLPPIGFAGIGPELYIYHGAALLLGGGAMIVRGGSGTGKSALLLALLAQTEAAFISDDMLVMDPLGQIWPIYRPVGVRSVILDRLDRHQREVAMSALPISTVSGITYMVRPADLTALAPMQGHPVTLDVKLTRASGFACHVSRLGRLIRLEIAYDPETAFNSAADTVAGHLRQTAR